MTSILKATVLGLGLVAGTAALAQAQSVATLPPNGGVPTQAQDQAQGQTARTWPYGSTQSYYPKPGGSEVITEPNSQPATAATVNPYSTGPKTN